jgi:hypothetical protein
LEEYRRTYVGDSAALFDVSGVPIEPERRLVSENASSDLAATDVADIVSGEAAESRTAGVLRARSVAR